MIPEDQQIKMPADAPTVILIPIFNDWPAAVLLLKKIDTRMAEHHRRVSVLFVDDGSTENAENCFSNLAFESIKSVDVLVLKRNLGHQRAIAAGLAYSAENMPCKTLVIMDGDGEDDPSDIPTFLKHLEKDRKSLIVFAERTRRTEGTFFRFCYLSYRILHFVLTGVRVRVGNFSAVRGSAVKKLVILSELWNHYSAAVFVSKLPFATVPACRARRLDGNSKMNFQDLVIHGLRALSVFAETITVRFLVFSGSALALLGLFIIALALKGIFAESASTSVCTTAGMLIVALLQGFAVTTVIAFLLISGRSYSHFIPCRDYGNFVDSCRRLYEAANDTE